MSIQQSLPFRRKKKNGRRDQQKNNRRQVPPPLPPPPHVPFRSPRVQSPRRVFSPPLRKNPRPTPHKLTPTRKTTLLVLPHIRGEKKRGGGVRIARAWGASRTPTTPSCGRLPSLTCLFAFVANAMNGIRNPQHTHTLSLSRRAIVFRMPTNVVEQLCVPTKKTKDQPTKRNKEVGEEAPKRGNCVMELAI